MRQSIGEDRGPIGIWIGFERREWITRAEPVAEVRASIADGRERGDVQESDESCFAASAQWQHTVELERSRRDSDKRVPPLHRTPKSSCRGRLSHLQAAQSRKAAPVTRRLGASNGSFDLFLQLAPTFFGLGELLCQS